MPLFPAYATEDVAGNVDTGIQGVVWEATESREAQLLASDSEAETSTNPALLPTFGRDHFYLDNRLDKGNLPVSTLYYPGRPQYDRHAKLLAVGVDARGHLGGRHFRRYWAKRVIDAPEAPATAERAAAYRELLLKQPEDEHLWEQYINFQEACSGTEAALAAAEQAADRAPHSRRLRERLVQVARVALPRDRLLQRLRDLLAREKRPRARAELWCSLVELAGAAGGASAARSTVAAALTDTRGYPPAYPRLLHAYGVFLRTAGLWEELVLLMELVAGMAGALPPPKPPAAPSADTEGRLRDAEERTLSSGLPLAALWVRVERTRAAAHWRPAPASDAQELTADPQRVPLAHDLAELLRPVVGAQHALLLCVTLLRLVKVPLLPGSEYGTHAWGAPADDCAEALLPLLRAARRLPPAHSARAPPRATRRLLAALLDPPHYFTDDDGFLRWVRALWDACCGWAQGERRAALLGWRLRWLHALLLLVDPAERDAAAEVARIRDEARALLQQFASEGAGAPLAFAQFARIEHAAGAPARGARVAVRALRAALQDSTAPPHHALYIARVVCEVSAGAAGAGTHALVSAVLGRALPPDAPPCSDEELRAALDICEERCAALERRYAGGGCGERRDDESEQCLAALLPAEAEWGAARALLASPARRASLLAALPAAALQSARDGDGGDGGEGARYYEQSACALVSGGGGGGGAARALAALFPHNAYLALAGAGAPLWKWRCVLAPPPRAPPAALAALLPALLRAEAADWPPQEAEACSRAARRVCGAGAGGALLGALRLEVEGRAPHPRLLPALYEALERTPHAKWLHVRGAAWCGGEAAVMADALLDKQLRTHALLDELAALVPAAHPAHPANPTPSAHILK